MCILCVHVYAHRHSSSPCTALRIKGVDKLPTIMNGVLVHSARLHDDIHWSFTEQELCVRGLLTCCASFVLYNYKKLGGLLVSHPPSSPLSMPLQVWECVWERDLESSNLEMIRSEEDWFSNAAEAWSEGRVKLRPLYGWRSYNRWWP